MRTRVALIAAIVASGGLATGPALTRAAAAPLRSCTPTHGTVVVVDFAHWGGPIVRGCGVGQHTGYALLHAAGFTTAGDEHDGPAIVCRLGDAAFHHGTQYPTPTQDRCVQTPPTTGYWAYWTAQKGTNHWTYNPLGAFGDVPKPGAVELWTFGATNAAGTRGTAVPAISPGTLRAHEATRRRTRTTTSRTMTTTSTPTRSTSTSASRTTSTTQTMTTTTSSTTQSQTTTTTPHHHASTPTHPPARPTTHHAGRHRHRRQRPRRTAQITATVSTSTTRTGGAKIVSARPTSRRGSAGSSTPLLVGGALILLLAAGAGRAAWLRRREE